LLQLLASIFRSGFGQGRSAISKQRSQTSRKTKAKCRRTKQRSSSKSQTTAQQGAAPDRRQFGSFCSVSALLVVGRNWAAAGELGVLPVRDTFRVAEQKTTNTKVRPHSTVLTQ